MLTFIIVVAYSVTMKKDRSKILNDVFRACGNASTLAEWLGVSKQAVSNWDKVPLRHLKFISEQTGISRRKLRPDLYD